MFARSSTINGKRASLDRGIAFLGDELMAELLAIDGCVGVSLLVDRETGRCIATSSWQSQAAMRASEVIVPPMRTRLMDAFGATEISNKEWEVVVMHRDHAAPPGAHARVTYLRGDPTRASEVFKSFLPVIEDFPGFCSASLLLGDSGWAVSTVIFDSHDGVVRTARQAAQLRARSADEMGAETIEVAEFELALAHLRVPELV